MFTNYKSFISFKCFFPIELHEVINTVLSRYMVSHVDPHHLAKLGYFSWSLMTNTDSTISKICLRKTKVKTTTAIYVWNFAWSHQYCQTTCQNLRVKSKLSHPHLVHSTQSFQLNTCLKSVLTVLVGHFTSNSDFHISHFSFRFWNNNDNIKTVAETMLKILTNVVCFLGFSQTVSVHRPFPSVRTWRPRNTTFQAQRLPTSVWRDTPSAKTTLVESCAGPTRICCHSGTALQSVSVSW